MDLSGSQSAIKHLLSKPQVEKNSKAYYFNANSMQSCTLVSRRGNYTANIWVLKL